MEILGMSLETVTEAIMTHMVLTFALFHLMRVKEKRRRLAFVWMISLCLCDVVIVYFLANVDIYSEMVYRSVKGMVFLLLLSSCMYFFEETFWKTLVAMLWGDLFAGVPGILRMLTCQLFGIPMTGLETGDYPWSLKALYLFYVIIGYLLVRKWMKRYKDNDGKFGLFWKLAVLVYLLPVFSSIYTGIIQMKTDTSYVGPLVVAPLAMIVFIVAVRMERSRRLRLENRYLRLQTSLFSEHEQVLKEQQRMVNDLADWLEETRLELPAAGVITKRRTQMAGADYCESEMVNLAIGNKVGQCEEQDIRVEIEMEHIILPEWLREIDLLTILYNLFDNAARAAGECEGENRYIRLRLAAGPQRLTVLMENGRRGGKGDRSRKPGRPGRGQGLGIIAETVRRYHGEAEHREEADRYVVSLMLRGDRP